MGRVNVQNRCRATVSLLLLFLLHFPTLIRLEHHHEHHHYAGYAHALHQQEEKCEACQFEFSIFIDAVPADQPNQVAYTFVTIAAGSVDALDDSRFNLQNLRAPPVV